MIPSRFLSRPLWLRPVIFALCYNLKLNYRINLTSERCSYNIPPELRIQDSLRFEMSVIIRIPSWTRILSTGTSLHEAYVTCLKLWMNEEHRGTPHHKSASNTESCSQTGSILIWTSLSRPISSQGFAGRLKPASTLGRELYQIGEFQQIQSNLC